MSKDKEIELINEIVVQAVIHGGDSSGPYYTNSNALYKALKKWLVENCLTDEFIDAKHREIYPDMFVIVPKEDETEEYHIFVGEIAF